MSTNRNIPDALLVLNDGTRINPNDARRHGEFILAGFRPRLPAILQLRYRRIAFSCPEF